MKRDERVNMGQLTIGGLREDDFEWAHKQYAERGSVLVGFVSDFGGYYWTAVCVKTGQIDPSPLGLFW